MAKRVLIIGPSKSGKTCYLSALQLAAELTYMSRGPACKVIPAADSPAMLELSELARRAILDGRLPINPSNEKKEYAFHFEAENRGFWTIVFTGNTHHTRFELIDSPGGVLLPTRADANGSEDEFAAHAELRQELLFKARHADSLMLCVDAHDDRVAADFFINLPSFFNSIDIHPLPYERIVVLLTKSDRYFARHGAAAESVARRTDPWPRALELLTPAGLGALLRYVDPQRTELASGWVSAYGFVPGEGWANYDPAENRLRVFNGSRTASQVADLWRPFRVLEPLSYLCAGELGSLSILKIRR